MVHADTNVHQSELRVAHFLLHSNVASAVAGDPLKNVQFTVIAAKSNLSSARICHARGLSLNAEEVTHSVLLKM